MTTLTRILTAAPTYIVDRIVVPVATSYLTHLPLAFTVSLVLLAAGAVVALLSRRLRPGGRRG